jgi:hypothetical protein
MHEDIKLEELLWQAAGSIQQPESFNLITQLFFLQNFDLLRAYEIEMWIGISVMNILGWQFIRRAPSSELRDIGASDFGHRGDPRKARVEPEVSDVCNLAAGHGFFPLL